MTQSELVVGGPIALELHWDGDVIATIRLRWRAQGEEESVTSGFGRAMAQALARYVAGQEPCWPDIPADHGGMSDFQRRVLEELRRVPSGQALSYGELAALSGRPGAARAVGRVMASNPWPLVVPCHRVLASGGRLGGFGPGPEMKRWLLELEGFTPRG